jgi:hypothetical protein
VDLFQDGAELGHVEARGIGRLDAEIAAGDFAAKRQALQVKKPSCPLQIG